MYGWHGYSSVWTSFLHGVDPLIGIPLCAAGAALVLAGWRLWWLASVVSLGLVGAVVGQVVSGADGFSLTWGGGGAVLFALAGAVRVRHSATVLGGAVGAGMGLLLLNSIGLAGWPQVVGGVIAFAGAAAWSFANRQRVVVVITSLEGGVLLASGVAAMITEVPMLHSYFRSMTISSPFMVLFFVLVPTVIGVTLQQADANRSSSKAVRG